MFVKRICTTNFRNLSNIDIELPDQGALFFGNNSAGKSNFLEAIYYLSLFRSFRGSKDEQLIGFGKTFFRLMGQLQVDSVTSRTVEAGYDGQTKKVKVDGQEEKKISEAVGHLRSVIVTPDDIQIVKAAPHWRRKFLDVLLSLVNRRYMSALQNYRAALAQRNSLLRDYLGRRNRDALLPWNEQLVEFGSYLIFVRQQFLQDIQDMYGDYYELLSGGDNGSVYYKTTIKSEPYTREPKSLEIVKEEFTDQLVRQEDAEMERGQSLLGPHLDDLVFETDGKDLRAYGSQGQQRTAVIVLRLVEGAYTKKASGRRPTYLFDDVFAELDPERSRRLLSLVEPGSQILITSPKRVDIEDLKQELPEYRVEAGQVLVA